MNTYRHTFVAECPSQPASIIYSLEISSAKMIHVEHIVAACALYKKGYHEVIADDLYSRFGGYQRIVASHHGVEITTERGVK